MQITENVRDIMRSPEYVLNSLTEHSENLNYKFERLYRIFFNEYLHSKGIDRHGHAHAKGNEDYENIYNHSAVYN